MKLLTHIAVSLAVSSMTYAVIDRDVSIINSIFILSLTINYVIDVLGHKHGRRTALTHEVISNLTLSLVIALILWFTILKQSQVFVALATAVITSTTHILLDAFTGYIYIRDLHSIRKIRLSPRRYDDYLLNTLAMGLALIIMFITLATVFN